MAETDVSGVPLCGQHSDAKPPYIKTTRNGFEWYLKDETGMTNCHCGKTAVWLKITSNFK